MTESMRRVVPEGTGFTLQGYQALWQLALKQLSIKIVKSLLKTAVLSFSYHNPQPASLWIVRSKIAILGLTAQSTYYLLFPFVLVICP